MSEYDDLIKQAAAQFAECTISPTPEREAALGRFIGEALQLRYGRLWVPRDDAINLWRDVVETLRRTLKAGTLPGQLGDDPAAIKHVLDVEIPTMPRAQIVQMVDYYLGCFRLRVDIWDAIGNSIVDDFEVAEATYRAAVTRWPRARITLRQGSRVMHDTG